MSLHRRWLSYVLLSAALVSRIEAQEQSEVGAVQAAQNNISEGQRKAPDQVPQNAGGDAGRQDHLASASVPSRPLGRGVTAYRPSQADKGAGMSRNGRNPEGQITLRDALALALEQSPELGAYDWEIRAREARTLQAGRRPNPILSTLAEEFGGFSSRTGDGITGPGGVIQPQITVQMSQLIELGGKRIARQNLAARTRDLAAWDYETARLDVFTRVTRAFLDVLASQRTVALAQQTTAVVEQVREAVGLRVVAGVVSPIEETRANVALAAVRIESARIQRTLDADRQRLAALWGSDAPRFEVAVGDLDTLFPIPTMTQLQQRLSQNPELARWAAEIEQREAALALERANRVPDLSVTGGYRRFTNIGGSAFVAGVSIPVPLFNKNRDAIQEARDRVVKASEEQRTAWLRVTTMLAESYRALASAKDEVTALAANVRPGTRSAFEGITEGYRAGKFSFLEVLDTQRTLVATEGQYLRALSAYHQAVAEVERLIGEPLSAFGPATPGRVK